MAYIEFSKRAALDLVEIERYSIEQWGKTVADKYIDNFTHAAKRLADQPSLLKDKQDISTRLKFYRVEKHFMICDTINDNIYVLAIRHGSMDLPTLVAELEQQLAQEAELMHQRFLATRKNS